MASLNRVLQRFKVDQEELRKSPVANVSATPLEENMFEWHCNIRQEDIIFHLILFFPKEYPYKSPSAEFVPPGFQYSGGATKPGKKGTQICLNIFSDFSNVHTEWSSQKAAGWSPAYTVQTILMNVVAFLAETQAKGCSSSAYTHNLQLSRSFSCPDCGHKYSSPSPALEISPEDSKDVAGSKKKSSSSKEEERSPQIIDYISKEKFVIQKPKSKEDIWGYGLVVSGTNWRPTLTSPCEFITGASFYGMKAAFGSVQSVFKEELKIFLPLFVHPTHGSGIQQEFEAAMKEVGGIMPKYSEKTPIEDLVLKTIPNLLTSTVVEFSKGTQHTSDNSLNGYFALHRLFLWAIDTYPSLQEMIEKQVKDYVLNEDSRSKDKVPYIAEWLMLVGGSNNYRWLDVADAYLSESWKRSPLWYVKDDYQLGLLDTPKEYRIKRTYELTEVARKHLAFQARFLDVAMPAGMTRKEVIKRYDDNLGFPTPEMVRTMKEAFVDINTNMKNYQDWFQILRLPPPSDDQLNSLFTEAVRFSILTKGYNWSGKAGGGWVTVLDKYKDMIKKNTEAKKKSGKEKDAAGKKPGSSSTRGKGKSATRGGKRKATIDKTAQEVTEEGGGLDNEPAPKKQAQGRAKGMRDIKDYFLPLPGKGQSRGSVGNQQGEGRGKGRGKDRGK